MADQKVAIVTGSNKGIGYAIVRGLCKQWDGEVLLAARDETRGLAAVEELKKEGFNPKFHQLDIEDQTSINTLRDFVKDNYGGLDILVNNAAMAYKGSSTVPFAEQADTSCRVNFWGNLNVCRALFPLLRSHARVVNISSFVSQWSLAKCSPEIKQRVLSAKTVSDVESFLNDFVQAAKAGKHEEKGFPEMGYGMSKVGMTALSIVQQSDLDADQTREDIIVNACDPGWVQTDMSSQTGNKNTEEGADTPLYAALLPANVKSPRGKLVSNRKIAKWTADVKRTPNSTDCDFE